MAEEYQTYYDILEVEETATDDELRRAYRRLCQEYHPDKLHALPEHLERLRRDAEARFREITEAYDVLRNAAKRAAYDRELRRFRGAPDTESSYAASQASTQQSQRASQPGPGIPKPQPPPAPKWAAAASPGSSSTSTPRQSISAAAVVAGGCGVLLLGVFALGMVEALSEYFSPVNRERRSGATARAIAAEQPPKYSFELAPGEKTRSPVRVSGELRPPVEHGHGLSYVYLSDWIALQHTGSGIRVDCDQWARVDWSKVYQVSDGLLWMHKKDCFALGLVNVGNRPVTIKVWYYNVP